MGLAAAQRANFDGFLCSAAIGFGFEIKIGRLQHYLQLTVINKVLCTPRESKKHLLLQLHAPLTGNSARIRSTASLREHELLEQLLQRKTHQRSADDRSRAPEPCAATSPL